MTHADTLSAQDKRSQIRLGTHLRLAMIPDEFRCRLEMFDKTSVVISAVIAIGHLSHVRPP